MTVHQAKGGWTLCMEMMLQTWMHTELITEAEISKRLQKSGGVYIPLMYRMRCRCILLNLSHSNLSCSLIETPLLG